MSWLLTVVKWPYKESDSETKINLNFLKPSSRYYIHFAKKITKSSRALVQTKLFARVKSYGSQVVGRMVFFKHWNNILYQTWNTVYSYHCILLIWSSHIDNVFTLWFRPQKDPRNENLECNMEFLYYHKIRLINS